MGRTKQWAWHSNQTEVPAARPRKCVCVCVCEINTQLGCLNGRVLEQLNKFLLEFDNKIEGRTEAFGITRVLLFSPIVPILVMYNAAELNDIVYI